MISPGDIAWHVLIFAVAEEIPKDLSDLFEESMIGLDDLFS